MPNTCVNYEKKCGGCPLLALPYREQLAKKQARLQELLGGFAPVKAVQGMAEPLHYRNKAHCRAGCGHRRVSPSAACTPMGTHRVVPGAALPCIEEIAALRPHRPDHRRDAACAYKLDASTTRTAHRGFLRHIRASARGM